MVEEQNWSAAIPLAWANQSHDRRDVGLSDLQHSAVDSAALESPGGVVRSLKKA